LERRGRVILVDLKGFGGSAKPDDGRYGPHDQVALLGALIERDDPGHLTLVGHSFGGAIALLTALTMSERADRRLRRLVIVSGAAYPQRLPPFVTFARYPRLSAAALAVLGPNLVIRTALRAVVADPACIDDRQVDAYAAALRTREGVRAAFAAALQLVPADISAIVDRYPRVEVPTLLLWGRHDRVVPLATGARLAAVLPNARLEVLEACGHIAHEEQPERSLALLERFLVDGNG
jgi:pimeloyl-ACP methyl ester carboxylesterase